MEKGREMTENLVLLSSLLGDGETTGMFPCSGTVHVGTDRYPVVAGGKISIGEDKTLKFKTSYGYEITCLNRAGFVPNMVAAVN